MPRKSVDIAHVNLRIRESLRKKLADEAEKHRFSLNTEIRVRLEASFERQAFGSLAESTAFLVAAHKRLDARLRGLDRQGDLLRASEALLRAIEQGEHKAIKDAAAQVKQTTDMIDEEAKATVRRSQTTQEKP